MALPISSSYRLFWTGKYLERAEITARWLDQKLLLTLDTAEGSLSQILAWEEILRAYGVHSPYLRRHGQVNARDVISFMVLDEQCPSSIIHAVHMARENASGSMPDEIFIAINKLYLKLRETGVSEELAREPHKFLSEVVETCMLVVGIVNRLWG